MAPAKTPYDPESDGARMRFDGCMSYGDYLKLGQVLTAQSPLSDAHDEYLFIIQHQTAELWMKLAVHEMTAAKVAISSDQLQPAFKMLTRTSRILEQLNSAWDVLRTMTPSEYASFRDVLGQASGFQSYQYRAIEFLAGNKNRAMLRPHAHVPAVHDWLEGLRRETSLYDEAIALLARSGLPVEEAVLTRDVSMPYASSKSVRAAWTQVYRQPQAHWPLYELGEKLVDFEDCFRRWRFNHLTTVERIIGSKRGTGGTSGATYLRRMLNVVLFPELWDLRADL